MRNSAAKRSGEDSDREWRTVVGGERVVPASALVLAAAARVGQHAVRQLHAPEARRRAARLVRMRTLTVFIAISIDIPSECVCVCVCKVEGRTSAARR